MWHKLIKHVNFSVTIHIKAATRTRKGNAMRRTKILNEKKLAVGMALQ